MKIFFCIMHCNVNMYHFIKYLIKYQQLMVLTHGALYRTVLNSTKRHHCLDCLLLVRMYGYFVHEMSENPFLMGYIISILTKTYIEYMRHVSENQMCGNPDFKLIGSWLKPCRSCRFIDIYCRNRNRMSL